MEDSRPKDWREHPITRDPKYLNDPRNAPYLYEGPDGDRFIDWLNPGHRLENWAKRAEILATASEEEKYEFYRNLYYAKLVKRNRLGPDYQNGEKNEEGEKGNIEIMPPARLPLPADEVLKIMKSLKNRIKRLESQKYLLAQMASLSGCPEKSNPDCPLRQFEPKLRDVPSCSKCWMQYADEKIRIIEPDE